MDSIFKNKDGKVVIWQNPNVLFWLWIVATVFAIVFKQNHFADGAHRIGSASLFAWAYLEIKSGDSLFRRGLGVVVMTGIIYGYLFS